MTADALARHFNQTFGLGEWPQTYAVDFETYGHVAHTLLTRWYETTGTAEIAIGDPGVVSICLSVGPHKQLLFKNVELIPQDRP